jgi:integrase
MDVSSVRFQGGRYLGPLPTLYSHNYKYVAPVNQWFIHLKADKRLENLNSYARALKHYWDFLESEKLEWDAFPVAKGLKPTYRFRNDVLLKKTKTGDIACSTANTYMNHIVQFYIWAANECYYPLTDTHKPFEIEFVSFRSHDILAHMKPRFIVQTTDLRIRVPRDSTTQNIHRLTPLSQQSLIHLSLQLYLTSVEMRLICLLAVQCGLRIEEASGFTLTALNQSVQREGSRTHYEIIIGPGNGVPTKYNKTRTIEIPKVLLSKLQNYAISERRINRLFKLREHIDNYKNSADSVQIAPPTFSRIKKTKKPMFMSADRYEPLFISQQGNPYSPETTGARFSDIRYALRASGIIFHHKFHDLRCSYATYRLHSLLTAGLEPADALSMLMQWMGHKHESTTWKYLRHLKHKEVLEDKISILDTIMHQALQGATDEG